MQRLSMSLKELPPNGSVAIYGTGKRGQDYYSIISTCRPDVTILCFLDSFKENNTLSPPILKTSSVNPENFNVDIVLVCSDFYLEIDCHLRELGLISSDSISTYFADFFVEILPADEAKKCEEMFKQLLDKLPNESFVYDALGRLEIQKNNFDSALFYYRHAQDKFPNDIWGYVGSAKALKEMKRFQESEELYRSVITKFPDSPAGYLGCAGVFQETTRYAEAEKMYRSVIVKFPDNPAGYLGCANIFQEKTHYVEAEDMYRSVIARFPKNPAGYLGCAGVFQEAHHYAEAEDMYRSVIAKFPDNSAGYLGCAGVFQETTRYAEAEDMYRSVIAKFPDNPTGYLGCAGVFQETTRYAEAEKMYNLSLETTSSFHGLPPSHNRLSKIMMTSKAFLNCSSPSARMLLSDSYDVVIVGDSHAGATFLNFNNIRSIKSLVSYIPGAAATGFSRKESRLRSYERISLGVRQLRPRFVVYKFGQVDVEFGYYYRVVYKKDFLDIETFFHAVADLYIRTILHSHADISSIPIVSCINPPIIADNKSFAIKVKATIEGERRRMILDEKFDEIVCLSLNIERRTNIARLFNSILKFYCNKYSIKFFDFFDLLTSGNTSIAKEKYINKFDTHIFANVDELDDIYAKLQLVM